MTRVFLVPLLAALLAPAARGERVAFNRDVRPILADKCFACHGPDTSHRKAKLRLDTADGARKVLVAGKAHESELYARITREEERGRMPPVKSGKALSPSEIALLRQWIDEGAVFEQHWSFARLRRPALPVVQGPNWSRNPV